MMLINFDSLNPTLGYKLDPGEPGLAYSAPASRSVIRVLSQELSNLIAFKNQALREGGVVIYSKISLDMQKRGMFLAAVAGKTEVKIYIPGDERKTFSNDNSMLYNLQGTDESQKFKLEKLKHLLELKLLTEKDPEKLQEIENKLMLIESILNNPVLRNSKLILQGLFVNEIS